MESLINIILLILLLITAVSIACMRDLFVVTMLLSVYGLLSASFFVALDAVDVAFTEASVGAGISTLLMLVVISMVGRSESKTRYKPLLALVVVALTASLLIYGTLDMPYFGSQEAPIHNHVANRYINDSMQEVGIPNIVTSVLASYRAFDTFGEVVVIFTAGLGVLTILPTVKHLSGSTHSTLATDPLHKRYMVIRIVAKILMPFILLFALYVQFHGDFGPGGGFQAGVIFAAAIILYTMLFGLKAALAVINQRIIQLIGAAGVLVYASVGIASMLGGGNAFDYNVLMNNPLAGQHLGILVIELGVGCTVASVMVMIFFSFCVSREVQQQHKPDKEE